MNITESDDEDGTCEEDEDSYLDEESDSNNQCFYKDEVEPDDLSSDKINRFRSFEAVNYTIDANAYAKT